MRALFVGVVMLLALAAAGNADAFRTSQGLQLAISNSCRNLRSRASAGAALPTRSSIRFLDDLFTTGGSLRPRSSKCPGYAILRVRRIPLHPIQVAGSHFCK